MPLFAALHATVYVNFALLARPRMRHLPYRLLVSWPAALFAAGTLLALPWALARAFGFHPLAPWLPYALGAVGLFQSLTTREEEIDLVIGGPERTPDVAPHAKGDAREARPLRIVQIDRPAHRPVHVRRTPPADCRERGREGARSDLPDRRFLTMESQSDPELLRRALEPLGAMPGKVFACHGNHDHEAMETVAKALAENGITLLIDEERDVETEAGPVQILGMDFVWRDRRAHLERVCKEHPRKPGMTRDRPVARPRRVQASARGGRKLSSPGTRTAGKWGS